MAGRGFLCALHFTPNKTNPHWNLLKVVLNTKPSSLYVSNRVRLHLFYVGRFFLLYRTLGFMQIPDIFRSITEIVI